MITVGTDLVHVPSLREQLEDSASAFRARTFTDAELAYAESAPGGRAEQHLAARFAAKEATLKALDHAAALRKMVPPSVALKSIEILRDERGRPSLALHDDASALASELGVERAQLSLSHDGDYAVAFVTLSLAQ
ncbi:MAG: holo-ACP synthase [Deltaproteobacteria bacterium]|nr:holo-ACP synthase [Deltaproteobacteria bacterium]